MTDIDDDLFYRVQRDLIQARAKLSEAEYGLLAYARCGDDDPDVYERMNREIESLFHEVETLEELEMDLRGEARACMYH
jgi:hypothetical protein